MPGSTPNQGFPYPLASDRQCDWPATSALLASALEQKATSFDTDVARLQKRRSVKISRSGNPTFTWDTTAGKWLFDTVEYNNGTPTDLTVDPYSVQLASGFYLLQGKLIVPTSGAASTGLWHARFNPTPAAITVPQGQSTGRDYGSGYTPLTITWMELAYVTSTTGKVGISILAPAVNVVTANYLSLTAWWMSDA